MATVTGTSKSHKKASQKARSQACPLQFSSASCAVPNPSLSLTDPFFVFFCFFLFVCSSSNNLVVSHVWHAPRPLFFCRTSLPGRASPHLLPSLPPVSLCRVCRPTKSASHNLYSFFDFALSFKISLLPQVSRFPHRRFPSS